MSKKQSTPAVLRALAGAGQLDGNSIFHLHQVHFRVVSAAELDGTGAPGEVMGDGVMLDNVPLVHADGTCTTVQDWRDGDSTAHPTVVEIPFTIAGDFVYHCHILEHEDGGMMARIRVRPNPG